MSSHRTNRRGLSTLELVLALPILLFVMALTVNVGVIACWKVRGLSASRNALWSTRYPRTASANPRPTYWPQGAGLGVAAGGNLTELDDPRVDQPVARGPLPGTNSVNSDLLDPTRGLRVGSATLSQGYAMLRNLGTYRLQAGTAMLDDVWQYARMGLPANFYRRIPVIYALQTAAASYTAAYVNAVVAIYYNAALLAALRPLDRDDEFIYYGQLFGWGGAPDFHPRLNGFCDDDRATAEPRVEELIIRIRGQKDPPMSDLAERMARAFINLYQRAIQEYQGLLAAQPPPSAAERAAMQAQISQLQAKIDQLNRFLQTLQN
jgi:hypothetical protein